MTLHTDIVMEISVSVQELYPQTIEGYQLVEFVTYKTESDGNNV